MLGWVGLGLAGGQAGRQAGRQGGREWQGMAAVRTRTPLPPNRAISTLLYYLYHRPVLEYGDGDDDDVTMMRGLLSSGVTISSRGRRRNV